MIKNRSLSFVVMFLIYALTVVTSVFIFKKLDTELCTSILLLDVIATVEVFIFSVIFRNASVYDPYWSIQPIVILVFVAIEHGLNLLGILVLIAVSFWGIRLTANWAYTFHGLQFQDWRYTMLKEKTKWFYPVVNFFGIHMIPTLVVYMCVAPAVMIIHNGFEFNPWILFFIALSICAACIQLVADIQMHTFRKNGGKGFIRVGLWKHGRHPNYLGEVLMWWGVAFTCFVSCPDKSSWPLIFAGAFANTCLFLFISIPMADKHQARKDGFAEYRKETRLFI